MEATINYTTKAGAINPIETSPQIKVKKPDKDSSLGNLPLSGISLTAPISYWRWDDILEIEQTDVTYPSPIQYDRLSSPLHGREELDMWLRNKSLDAPSIEEVWRITEKLPSLTDILLEERNNE